MDEFLWPLKRERNIIRYNIALKPGDHGLFEYRVGLDKKILSIAMNEHRRAEFSLGGE
jgi:hypothetical protein